MKAISIWCRRHESMKASHQRLILGKGSQFVKSHLPRCHRLLDEDPPPPAHRLHHLLQQRTLMHGQGTLSSPRVVRAFDQGLFRRLVDLAGATGHLVIAACRRWPELWDVVLDLPDA